MPSFKSRSCFAHIFLVWTETNVETLHLPYKGCHEVKPNTQNTAQLGRGMAGYLHGGRIQGLLCMRGHRPLSHPAAARSRQLAWTGNGFFQTAPASARLAKLRLESISPRLFFLHRQAQPARSSSSRQAGRQADPHTPAGSAAAACPRSLAPGQAAVPCSAAGPFPRRTSSPGALPACLSITQPAVPRPPPPPPLRREACRAAPAPQLRRGYGACGEESAAAPGALSPPSGCLVGREKGGAESSPSQLPWPRSTGGQSQGQKTTCPPCCNPILYGLLPSFRTKKTLCALPRRGGYGSTLLSESAFEAVVKAHWWWSLTLGLKIKL